MKGVFFMVKGISRRVVVVRPESGGPFEQAIFLVRDPAFPLGALTASLVHLLASLL